MRFSGGFILLPLQFYNDYINFGSQPLSRMPMFKGNKKGANPLID